MGNITLAFHLLCERADPNSFWQPYIQTLPSEYDTPLYFEEDEVRYLQSTQAIHDVFSQYKNTARQYAYFYKVIQVRAGSLVMGAEEREIEGLDGPLKHFAFGGKRHRVRSFRFGRNSA